MKNFLQLVGAIFCVVLITSIIQYIVMTYVSFGDYAVYGEWILRGVVILLLSVLTSWICGVVSGQGFTSSFFGISLVLTGLLVYFVKTFETLQTLITIPPIYIMRFLLYSCVVFVLVLIYQFFMPKK